ncbi:hypothetical protein CBL_14421 [Carabus blaptoides fortunei]
MLMQETVHEKTTLVHLHNKKRCSILSASVSAASKAQHTGNPVCCVVQYFVCSDLHAGSQQVTLLLHHTMDVRGTHCCNGARCPDRPPFGTPSLQECVETLTEILRYNIEPSV